VSVASEGTQADGYSRNAALSGDGGTWPFESGATNLVPGDTNGTDDIFVHDRQTGTTSRVSVASEGTQADGYSRNPALSADGRYVAFDSYSINLVPGTRTARATSSSTTARPGLRTGQRGKRRGPGGLQQLFSRDQRHRPLRGVQCGNCLVVLDRQTGYARWVMGAAGESFSISADGRFVALQAWADISSRGTSIRPMASSWSSTRWSSHLHLPSRHRPLRHPPSRCPGRASRGLFRRTPAWCSLRRDFPEALCGAPLAAAYGGPVLVTRGPGWTAG